MQDRFSCILKLENFVSFHSIFTCKLQSPAKLCGIHQRDLEEKMRATDKIWEWEVSFEFSKINEKVFEIVPFSSLKNVFTLFRETTKNVFLLY